MSIFYRDSGLHMNLTHDSGAFGGVRATVRALAEFFVGAVEG